MTLATNFSGKRITVLGGTSMLGGATAKLLAEQGAIVDPTPHAEVDLLDFQQCISRLIHFRPEIILNFAGYNGNISFNATLPARIYHTNSQLALNILQSAELLGVKKILSVLPSCAYPCDKELLREEDFWSGLPHSSVECHGLAKRQIHAFSRQLNKQYGLNAICVVLNNCYGKGDHFDLAKTKVGGAMVKRFVDAVRHNQPEVTLWGTSNPRRELLYAEDAAQGILLALTKYNDVELPLNIGSGKDVSIKELAETAAGLTSYQGKILWDKSKPDGQMCKLLDVSRMKRLLQWEPPTSLEEGLRKTIEYYKTYVEFEESILI